MKVRLWKGGIGVGLAAITAAAMAWQAAQKLYVNGSVASEDLRVIDGRSYVPLADVAKALNMTVQKKDDGYDLVKAGGAGEVGDKNAGKMGDEIFTGQWRFRLLKVTHAPTYHMRLSKLQAGKDLAAKDGFEYIVADCRIKNGRPERDELVFDNWDGNNTALTDANEQSYQPLAYDVTEDETAPDGTHFLPGAAINFALVFEVPKGTEAKNLIFTAIRYGFRSTGDQKSTKPDTIRVSLGG